MLKSLIFLSLAILLSVSIVGPSVFKLIEDDKDISLVTDTEDESNNEVKNELEETEKYFDKTEPSTFGLSPGKFHTYFYHRKKNYMYVQDLHSPPPEYFT